MTRYLLPFLLLALAANALEASTLPGRACLRLAGPLPTLCR